MGNDQKAMASHVVERFQDLLDKDAKDAIGEHNFHVLNSLVSDAIGEYSESIIEQLEDVLKQINAEIERRPLEL